jgi:hypothetical protein
MIVVFCGSAERDRLVRSGSFLCPNCRRDRFCTYRSIESRFHLFFVPLFRLDEVTEYVKCRDCRHCFTLPLMLPFLPRGGYLASDLRVELRSGASIERVERRLVESGVDRETARSVIRGMVGERLRSCPRCQLTYQENVVACWECGGPLGKGANSWPQLDEMPAPEKTTSPIAEPAAGSGVWDKELDGAP